MGCVVLCCVVSTETRLRYYESCGLLGGSFEIADFLRGWQIIVLQSKKDIQLSFFLEVGKWTSPALSMRKIWNWGLAEGGRDALF